MSQRSQDTIWNDSVEVGKTTRIAARGLTREHTHRPTRIHYAHVEGLIEDFWHDGGYTVVMLVNSRGQRIELTLEYMDEVEVTVE